MQSLEFLGLTRDAETAGPGVRLEYFTKGCIRGILNPCEGCFNESSWTFEGQKKTMTVEEVVDHALECAWNRQLTFCGGEPMLQAKAIAAVVKRLKERDPSFHVIMYTAYKLDTLLRYGLKFTWIPKYGEAMKASLDSYATSAVYSHHAEGVVNKIEYQVLSPDDVKELLMAVDMIVDGDYKMDKRLTTDTYMHKGWFIGSANQRVIDCAATMEICNTDKGEMIYQTAEDFNAYCAEHQPCLTCTKSTKDVCIEGQYCSESCMIAHQENQQKYKFSPHKEKERK